jgi:hypothetical protein
MQSFETGRRDIEIHRETGTGKPVRMVTIGSYGDETVKGLTETEAVDLAVALLQAAGMMGPVTAVDARVRALLQARMTDHEDSCNWDGRADGVRAQCLDHGLTFTLKA